MYIYRIYAAKEKEEEGKDNICVVNIYVSRT